MRSKKVLAGVLSATILSISTIAFAAMPEDVEIVNDVIPIMAENDELGSKLKSYFNSFTGIVKEVKEHAVIEGAQFVSVEAEEGNPANIIIASDTYVISNAELAVGTEVTCFYDVTKPMLMIYPPQYSAEVVVVGSGDFNVKVDVFDQDLVSMDNMLKLNVSADTEIVGEDGTVFASELAGEKLAVIYNASTKSIPAQATPSKIVVLAQEEEPAVQPVEERIISDVSGLAVIVENEKIEAPAAYTNKEGTVMVPLRAIAEALEMEISWDGALQKVMLGQEISLTIGEDIYLSPENDPIQLGTAPELIEGRTFVPLSFFQEVVGLQDVSITELEIIIAAAEEIS